jgi:hypothetical protein
MPPSAPSESPYGDLSIYPHSFADLFLLCQIATLLDLAENRLRQLAITGEP